MIREENIPFFTVLVPSMCILGALIVTGCDRLTRPSTIPRRIVTQPQCYWSYHDFRTAVCLNFWCEFVQNRLSEPMI